MRINYYTWMLEIVGKRVRKERRREAKGEQEQRMEKKIIGSVV